MERKLEDFREEPQTADLVTLAAQEAQGTAAAAATKVTVSFEQRRRRNTRGDVAFALALVFVAASGCISAASRLRGAAEQRGRLEVVSLFDELVDDALRVLTALVTTASAGATAGVSPLLVGARKVTVGIPAFLLVSCLVCCCCLLTAAAAAAAAAATAAARSI